MARTMGRFGTCSDLFSAKLVAVSAKPQEKLGHGFKVILATLTLSTFKLQKTRK